MGSWGRSRHVGRNTLNLRLGQRLVSLLAVVMLLAVGTVAAIAKVPFSAISVDARTGAVLFSVDPDGSRHPASLTKVMTLYLLFQDLKAGKVKLSTKFTVSKRAASMAPSKLGLKPGSTISVEDAIKALVTKSANDIACTIGENLGGTESAFAARMTKTARAIGMSRTTFKNASGLPNPAQVTTARDMATLSLRIQRDFPQYYPYFRIMSFTYKGRTIATHNRLLGRYEGTDGIKTGYIAASGYNLTTSVKRGDKRLVGVVMGGKTGNSRNLYMISMLDKTWSKAKGGKTVAALAGSSKGAIVPTEATSGTTETASAEAASEEKATKKKKTIVDLMKPKAKTEPEPQETADAGTAGTGDTAADDGEDGDAPAAGTTFKAVDASQPETTSVIEAKIGEPEQPAKLPFQVKPKADQSAVNGQLASTDGESWVVQIGAFDNKQEAQKKLIAIKKAQPQLLSDKPAFTQTVESDNQIIYRARFSGFSEKDAKAFCSKIAKQKVDCKPLPPQT